jgi:hypothetical protein
MRLLIFGGTWFLDRTLAECSATFSVTVWGLRASLEMSGRVWGAKQDTARDWHLGLRVSRELRDTLDQSRDRLGPGLAPA